MYSEYEKPIIICSIFYYDREYKKDTAAQVLHILTKYGMFPPEKFYAGKLTENRFVYAGKQARDILIQGYSEKDVLELDMSSGNSRKVTDYWRVQWGLTFYKNSRLAVEPVFLPWNVLSIHSTHGRLKDSKLYSDFFGCMKELIALLEPFYVSVDDVNNKVNLMDRAKEAHFVPDRIQEIFWGNYFGKDHCSRYGLDNLKRLPSKHIEVIGDGIFFSLTDSVLEYDSKECKNGRKKIKQYLEVIRRKTGEQSPPCHSSPKLRGNYAPVSKSSPTPKPPSDEGGGKTKF